jgi:hypothetical protein
MQKQLVASERPWVSAKISLFEPLSFTDKGGIIGVAAVMRNVGHSPAIDVRFASKVVVAYGAEDLQRRQVEYGEFWKKRSTAGGLPGNTISPADEHPYREFAGFDSDEIKTGLAKTSIPGEVAPTLIICIDYLYYSTQEHHQTWYAYPLGKPDPKRPTLGCHFSLLPVRPRTLCSSNL